MNFIAVRPFAVRFLALSACALTAAAFPAVSRAQLLFNNYTGEQTTPGNANVTLGTGFTVGAQNAILNALGVYDANGDGLSYSHQVGVWRVSDQFLVASVTIPSGTGTALVQDWRFVNLSTPITLSASTAYRIGALEAPTTGEGNPFGGTITLGSGIASTAAGSVYASGSFAYPASTDSTVRVFANASFASVAVPEPGALALLSTALPPVAGMVALRRRRRVA